MTLEPPWDAFDLPEASSAQASGQGLALTYPGAEVALFERAFARSGWERESRERSAVQTTSTWERDGWRVYVNTSPMQRTDTLDVRLLIIGIPESERWTDLRLPLGSGRIVRDNGRELGLLFEEGDAYTVGLAAVDRLVADGWAEGPTRSARTLVTRPDSPTLTVWAEPVGDDVLLHVQWDVAEPSTLPTLPPLATPAGPTGTLALLPRTPLLEPWLGLGLPIAEGAVVYCDATTLVVMYERGAVDARFRTYEQVVAAGGWSQTLTLNEGGTRLASYQRGDGMLTLAVMRSGDFTTAALTLQ